MKIRITGAKIHTYWYADKIGEVFDAELCGNGEYRVEDCRDGTVSAGYVEPTDCEVITEEVAPVNEGTTLLPDESIGGLLREYSGVKRKANVGERIKVTVESTMGERRTGEVYTVIEGGFDDLVDTDGKWDDGSTLNLVEREYVVLEPTDIVRIDGVRYRLAERKATVGERVLMLRKSIDLSYGDVYEVTSVSSSGRINHPDKVGSRRTSDVYQYRVLVPVESAPTPTPTADLAKQITGLTDAVAKLTLQLKVAREDIVLIEEGVRGEIAELKHTMLRRPPASHSDYSAVLHKGEVITTIPVRSPLTRDDIVERAKADVAELSEKMAAASPNKVGNNTFRNGVTYVEFQVNTKKRAVTALVYGSLLYLGLREKGIAKCAPDDVFNVHIGKAIALRRALGLEFPAEYVKAPQPMEARVGDIVKYTQEYRGPLRVYAENDPYDFPFSEGTYLSTAKGSKNLAIIDDSRESITSDNGEVSAA